MAKMTVALTQEHLRDPFWDPQDRSSDETNLLHRSTAPLSRFEKLISTHPPVLESLLLQLPTPAILQLYHTSKYLRSFLQSYPIAWSHLSFRNTAPGVVSAQGSTGSESSAEQRRSHPFALDQLLLVITMPFGTRLRTLDMDNTAVSGYVLTSAVLPQRRETLTHISVRGCKNVSLKYHIVPYLTVFGLERKAGGVPGPLHKRKGLALKSIYAYRCRHHRRRPYLPQSLVRRDSDSDPTHELVKICHDLGIWTDTAWCPTPGGRCLRRKEYHAGRSPGLSEVWVVFDRLWRSGNRIGDTEDRLVPVQPDGRLWEQNESGHDGEALGTGEGHEVGEGKAKPAHLRQSHKIFVEGIKCDQCGDSISERCEQCSVRMHCLGCRKTLCGSCAFDQPLPRKRRKQQHSSVGPSFIPAGASQRNSSDLWWAPGAYQSPNLMQEILEEDENAVAGPNVPAANGAPRKLRFQWCCLEPMFSGGGGIAFVGPGMNGSGANRIRTAPLPKGQGWEDPEFTPSMAKSFPLFAYGNKNAPDYTSGDGDDTMLRWFLRGSEDLQASSCPRSLCQECYNTMGWQAACKACKKPLCMEHDLRGLKMRICGYRDLTLEKAALRNAAQSMTLSAASAIPTTPDKDHFTQGQAIKIARHILGGLNNSQRSQLIASLVELPEDDDSDILDPTSHDDSRSITALSTTSDLDPQSNHSSRTTSRSSSQQSHPDDKSKSKSKSKPKSTKPPPWQGCASFFCQQFRSIGDHRNRCTGLLKECHSCGVHVCHDCLATNPPCTCTYCADTYNCPNCYRKLAAGICRKTVEELEKMMKAREQEMLKLAEVLSRRLADEVAGQVGDFFAGLGIEGGGGD
ncbi:hypothetical protein MMC16_007356 [Acarospora aff. strigata]|nr:hypothetical protein [Acarospora aff. strigata]